MNRFDIGDLVCYEVSEALPQSLGIITEVQDTDLVKVHWYVENITPHARRIREWIPAGILESAGSFKVLSKASLTNQNIVV